MKKSKGFTLIELMIVVAIIGILSAIAIPKFADLIRKSNEGATKGNLGAIRSSISIYYGELEGLFPNPNHDGGIATAGGTSLADVLLLENGKYIKDVPSCNVPPYHAKNSGEVQAGWTNITVTSANEVADPGAWGYQELFVTGGKQLGEIWVNCTHTDTKNGTWGSY